VHLLTRKEAGGPGVVGIDEGKHRYRVRFVADQDYNQAVMAHYDDRHIVVKGDHSKEGTLRWLYNAHLVSKPYEGPAVSDPAEHHQGGMGFTQ
jgi:hypothetical protein